MKRISTFLSSLLLSVLLLSSSIVQADEPAVKKSKSGICHPVGGTYYSRTKNYTPYSSMEKCIESGGRKPKR